MEVLIYADYMNSNNLHLNNFNIDLTINLFVYESDVIEKFPVIKEELPIGQNLRGATIARANIVDGNDNYNTLLTFNNNNINLLACSSDLIEKTFTMCKVSIRYESLLKIC